MELFSVNRYTANEEALKDGSQEDKILQKLLQKVEKRKRKRDKLEAQKQDNIVAKDSPVKSSKVEETTDEPFNENLISEENDQQKDLVSGDIAEGSGYKVLGEDVEFNQKQKVDMVLPPWLAYPTIISTNIAVTDTNAESSLEPISEMTYLAQHLRQSLKDMSINYLFPVQKCVIPWILQAHTKPMPFRPRDICVSAPTGSGKTLAFAVPIVQLLYQRVERKIRALVVLPVTELALQIFKVFKKLCEKTDLTVCLLSKQFAFPVEQKKLVECYKDRYYSKVDIIVTTPGRLVEHLHSTKGFCLKSLKFLVIDEADRIMDAVHHNWLYHLDSHVKTTSDMLLSGRSAPLCINELEENATTQPHKLLFSATLSQDPEKLQNLHLFQPKLFTSVLANLEELKKKLNTAGELNTEARGEFIGKYTTPAELTEKYCITESRLKPLTLYSLVKENDWTKFLCFTNSADSSGRLAFVLRILFGESFVIEELSASISAKKRALVLSMFSRGKVNGLVCSDALARGIDIPEVDIVLSYDPPRHIKTYIHRIGRTARAGRPGTAITLLTQQELSTFNQILSGVGKLITEEITVISATEEENAKLYSMALQALREKLEKDNRAKITNKARAKEKALIHKDPSKMTLMEKLQAQASEAAVEGAKKQNQPTLGKKNKSKTFKPKKEIAKRPFVKRKKNAQAKMSVDD